LLQLSALEFQQELSAALSSNPFLEYDENLTDEGSADTHPAERDGYDGHDHAASALPAQTAAEMPEQTAGEREPSDAMRETEHREERERDYLEESAQGAQGDFIDAGLRRASTRHNDMDGADPAEWVNLRLSLREHLCNELRLYALGERDGLIARLVIESLDDDGYLRQSFEDLMPLLDLEPPLGEDELRVALKLVQTMDAPGIGARTLAECLILQLEALPPDTPARELGLELASHHLERLAHREHAELQKQLSCDAEQLRQACALVRSLDPRPGGKFGEPENNYIVPDVIVYQTRSGWGVRINPAVLPRARVHQMYASLFAQSRASSHSPLAQQLQEARWLIRNAEQRCTTIQRVAECIVVHQKAFFDYGEIALKPLVLRDIADELGLHESTVSRATSNKYMATGRGIFEFRHFFPRELATQSGGTCSAAAVRALLKEMIAEENTGDPLSDVALARLLTEQGVQVARRTVTKYRQAMKLPPADLRRQGDR
jgi:RNA polymerase sigma-54 factor